MDRILIIQDSPSVNAMLKFRLEAEGFSVESAETGEEGIDKTRGGHYQLVLLDYKLPGMNGDQVCRILKKESHTRNTPIVLISAQDEDKLGQLTKEVGADGYIGLPLDGKKLVERIKGFLKKGGP
ncbi:MAG: response regulator [Deltaproteobacteria bacterium]|nr:response regulator [Deltaproteobacteria bacterium]